MSLMGEGVQVLAVEDKPLFKEEWTVRKKKTNKKIHILQIKVQAK